MTLPIGIAFSHHPSWCDEEHTDDIHATEAVCIELEAYPYVPINGSGNARTRHFGVLAIVEQKTGSSPQIIITPPNHGSEVRMTVDEAEDLIDILVNFVDLLYGHAPADGPSRQQRHYGSDRVLLRAVQADRRPASPGEV